MLLEISPRGLLIINEPDLYRLVYNSQLPKAEIEHLQANIGENITEAITSDPMRKAMVQIQGVFAELDKSLLVRKLRKAREKVRDQTGKCEGRKGYKDTEDGMVILREMRRLRRRRKGMRQLTFDEVAAQLNSLGYTAANGRPFTGNTVRGIIHRAKKR